MNIGRKKKSIYNIISSLVNKLIVIAMGLILPKLFITNFGSEINGLLGSIKNLFIYINLLEGGIALSSLRALYGPISNNDNAKVNSILMATTISYRKVGKMVLLLVIVLAFIYPLMIQSTMDYGVIALIILIEGFVIALDYFVQARNRVLLQAEAKSYVISNFNTIFQIISNSTKILLIYRGANIIKIQLSFAIINIMKIIFFQIYIYKKCSKIETNVKPDFESISNRKHAFIHNLVYIISANIDIFIITIFLGLKEVSVYMIYSQIFSSVTMLVDCLMDGLNSSLGQIFHNDRKRFIEIFEKFEFAYTIIIFSLYTIAVILTKPFIKIYLGNVEDIEYIINGLPMLFMIVELINKSRTPSTKIIHYTGKFKETIRPIIVEIIMNIILSIYLSRIIGIRGVVLATIISSIYRFIWYTEYANKMILNKNTKSIYRRFTLNLIASMICILLFNNKLFFIENFLQLIKVGLFVCVVMTLLFTIINCIIKYSIITTKFNKVKISIK